MEPLITNRLDPALLRVIEKRGGEHETPPRRRRPSPSEKQDANEESDAEATRHELDDLA
ncbi:MAG TPA: hypothetical protein VLT90_16920 [Terriglobales bacterium]|nr:hypothetical protein [Terriglobales bacterium]